MDLHWMEASPTEAERAAVDRVLGPPESGWHGAPERSEEDERHSRAGLHEAKKRRHLLLPALHGVQDSLGWISKGALNYICQRLSVPPAEAFGVASFYALLSTHERPPRVAHVCDDIACKAAGADRICRELSERLGPAGSSHSGNGAGPITWHRSPCLGQCEKAPAAFFQLAGDDQNESIGTASTESIVSRLKGESKASEPVAPTITAPQTASPRDPELRLLARVGLVDPESLDSYRAEGGYRALRRALELGPEGVIREIQDSKIRGRGGAAFPMGIKWDAVAKAPRRPHYLVCNADESEPGTFKDRVLMEEDPFAVIEAMTIAGYATGAEQGFLYVRGEYPLAESRIGNAIRRARQRGWLGEDVMGEGVHFDIELRRGAGAYICGEETALFNSIEGYRGEPRNKPPFPTQEGLFGKPTVVNNVETLVNAIDIVLEGGPAFARIGTEDSTGPKLFCLSGAVAKPGLYEVPFGTTLRELLDRSGGVTKGRSIQTILLGGAAGAFLPPDRLDVPLTFEGLREAGATLGSGVVMVFDDRAEMTDMLLRIAAFFRDESCGQCVPCRVGTARQEEALRRIASGRFLDSREGEVALIDELAQVMRDASICGLGHTAASAIQSAIGLNLLNGDGPESGKDGKK